MTTDSLERKVNDLAETVKGYQHEIERLQAVNEIQNLMSRYEYLHMTNQHKEVMELHAKKSPDITISIKETGVWKGPDGPRKAWENLERMTGENPIGMMAVHPTTTPLIEVAGDGKTAKAVWIGTGLVASVNRETGKPQCMWEWDRYGIDFIKEDGKWKFWHFHLYGLFSSGWDDKWEEQFTKEKAAISVPDDLKPDGPPVDDYPHRPDTVSQLIPALPEPYETFDDTFSY
jgi:hypothetical protein